MSGLGGLNKSPAGVVLGMVQLQLPTVSDAARAGGADRTDRGDGRQGAAQHAGHGPGRLPRVCAARPVDEHDARADVPPGRARGRRLSRRLPREPHLGLLLDHGGEPARQPLQHRHHPRRSRRAAALLSQAAPLGPGRAVGARQPRHPGVRRAERQPHRPHHLPRRHVSRDGARVRLQGRGDHSPHRRLHRADPARLAASPTRPTPSATSP